MEDILISNQQTFAVFTMDATADMWWNRFLKKPFWHVFLVYTWVENGKHYASIEDPYFDFKERKFKVRGGEPFEIIHWYSFLYSYREICINNFSYNQRPKILKIKINLDKYKSFFKYINMLPICTAYVANRFRIEGHYLSPYSLYKVMLKKGHRNLFW